MFDGFEAAEVPTGETSIFVRRCGSGAAILLLHGFPETHLMWRSVAPLLAREFTVICADLRGYGRREAGPDEVRHRRPPLQTHHRPLNRPTIFSRLIPSV